MPTHGGGQKGWLNTLLGAGSKRFGLEHPCDSQGAEERRLFSMRRLATTGVVRKSSVIVVLVDDEDPNEIVPMKNRLNWTGTIMHRDAQD